MRYWDWIDFVIVAFYGFAGIAAGIAFFNGHEPLDVAIVGFAVAGFGVTLAMVLSAIDKALREHYNR